MAEPTLWVLEKEIKTKKDLVEYVRAAIEDIPENFTPKDFEWLLIVCKETLEIAEKKGWKVG